MNEIVPRPRRMPGNGPFLGSWRVTEMEQWDADAVDMEAPAHFTFDDEAMGKFRFVAVRGSMDCRFSERAGHPAVDFSWGGEDDGDEVCGRGTAVIIAPGQMCGEIFIHCGMDSKFSAVLQPTVAGNRKTPMRNASGRRRR